jgi:hypothetical protein
MEYIVSVLHSNLHLYYLIGVAFIGNLTACASHWHTAKWEDNKTHINDRIDQWIEQAQQEQHRELQADVICAQCHSRQAQEFAGSTMRYAMISPVFNALELAFNQIGNGVFAHGGAQEGFCSACHGPQAMQSTLASSDTSFIENVTDVQSSIDPRIAIPNENMGLSCDFCHTLQLQKMQNLMIAQAPQATASQYKVGPNPQAISNKFHDIQDQTNASTFLQSSEFCSTCHDVRPSFSDAVTQEPFLRSEDLFSEWQRSPWSKADHPQNPMRGMTGIIGIHDDQDTSRGEQVTCQDCHMSLYPYRKFSDEIDYNTHFIGVDPKTLTRKAHKLYPVAQAVDPKKVYDSLLADSQKEDYKKIKRVRRVSTHHFTGVSNPMIPYPLVAIDDMTSWYTQNTNSLESEGSESSEQEYESLNGEKQINWSVWRAQDQQLKDTYGYKLRSFERRIDLLRAAVDLSLDEIPLITSRSTEIRLPIWLENIGAGHRVPAGFSQEREMWIDLELIDQGRPCTQNLQCQDLIEPPFFLNNVNRPCRVYDHQGQLDPALDETSMNWEENARRERSAFCSTQGYCGLYRSGYLLDLDGDQNLADEDLRHTLVDIDAQTMRERCVVSGPDADVRISGRQRGLIHFTNALQRVAVDENGDVKTYGRTAHLAPIALPYEDQGNLAQKTPVLVQDTQQRRSVYATQYALFERWRYTPALAIDAQGESRRGFGLNAPHLFMANRAYNGASLKPFEPRLALYEVYIPPTTVGPLSVNVKVRFRFFSPRLLRILAQRTPNLVSESMIDQALKIVDMQSDQRTIMIKE